MTEKEETMMQQSPVESMVLNAAHEAVAGRQIEEAFARQLVTEILDRVRSGKSADGDAFRCLLLARDRAREEGR